MEMFFKKSFVRDFQNLPAEIKKAVKNICLIVFPKLNNLRDLKGYDIKPLKGFTSYYRIRFGEYRIGFKKEGDSIIFMRIKHRKDIYRLFP